MPVRLTDTAGLRHSTDAAEAQGVARARAALERADVWLLVLDASQPLTEEDKTLLAARRQTPCLAALNKCDLPAAWGVERLHGLAPDAQALPISARTGEGLPALRTALAALAAAPAAQAAPLTQARHIRAAHAAADALVEAADALGAGLSLDAAAVDLHRALAFLGAITGENLEEEVLDAIFATFCVGK
jgi:tRNA modification GTPase